MRNGQLDTIEEKIAKLERIKPIDAKHGERWYPIQQKTRGGVQTVMCRGVNTIHRQLAHGPELMEWIKTHGLHSDTIRDRRAGEGRTVHSGVEHLHSGGEIRRKDHQDHVYRAFLSYRNFIEDEEPEQLAIEKTCYSLRWKLAGTLDQLNRYGDILSVDDVKFTKYVYDEQFRTTQTYAWLLREMGIPVDRVGIIHLGARTKRGYSYRKQDLDPRIKDDLIPALLDLWDYLHDDRTGPVLEELPDSISLPQRKPTPSPNGQLRKSKTR